MGKAVETEKTLQESAYINVALREDGSETFSRSFEAEVQDPDFPSGERGFSMEQLTSGGQERDYDPEETKTFSGTAYIKGVDASTARGIESLFYTGEVSGSSATKDVISDLSRDDTRIVFTAAAESLTDATAATSSGNAAYRLVMQNAELVSAESNFEDNTLTIEFEFETTAFTPAGVPNVRKLGVEPGSTDNLPSVPAYNDSFDIEAPDFGAA
jgi:hypothetical protein